MNNCHECFNLELERQRGNKKKSEPHVSYMYMLSFNGSILLKSVRTYEMVMDSKSGSKLFET